MTKSPSVVGDQLRSVLVAGHAGRCTYVTSTHALEVGMTRFKPSWFLISCRILLIRPFFLLLNNLAASILLHLLFNLSSPQSLAKVPQSPLLQLHLRQPASLERSSVAFSPKSPTEPCVSEPSPRRSTTTTKKSFPRVEQATITITIITTATADIIITGTRLGRATRVSTGGRTVTARDTALAGSTSLAHLELAS